MANYDCYETPRIAETVGAVPDGFTSGSLVIAGGSYIVPTVEEPEVEPDVPSIPTPDPAYTTIDVYDYELPAARRWDQISMDFYGTYDRILDLMDANPHISLEAKKALYLPIGTQLIIPREFDGVETSTISAKSWRA